MQIITTRELRNRTKAVCEMAEKDHVAVKRGKRYLNLTMSDAPIKPLLDEEWVREFFAVPEEFRVNPFDISPSGDLHWADRRNVEALNKAVKAAHEGPHVLPYRRGRGQVVPYGLKRCIRIDISKILSNIENRGKVPLYQR